MQQFDDIQKHLEKKSRNLAKYEEMTKKIPLPYKRFDKEIPALFRKDVRNAGFDLFARIPMPMTVEPGQAVFIPLNVATEIPPFAVGLLFQRSSTFSKWKVMLTNSVGVIDSLFCGDHDEWGAEFINVTQETAVINPGDKVCQAVFLPLLPVNPVEVDELGNADRG
ncbi:hypothetical protein G3578_09240 [Brevibacillus sp. SYP-B805]|uniref:dUTP diphosphatase n=1 Tax=Brevibacillus sp. SYP-B805 TaxID=1578199 RepID=UPI0013ECC27C|nr:hypothetical protein [Brevibacillus sp. SYP-B805]NGQ95338.1 hypothetical protein [Brevibacillus sp. SYP-B805]